MQMAVNRFILTVFYASFHLMMSCISYLRIVSDFCGLGVILSFHLLKIERFSALNWAHPDKFFISSSQFQISNYDKKIFSFLEVRDRFVSYLLYRFGF